MYNLALKDRQAATGRREDPGVLLPTTGGGTLTFAKGGKCKQEKALSRRKSEIFVGSE